MSTSGAGGGPTIGDFGTTDAELQVDQRRDLGVAFAFIEELEPLDAFVLVAGLHHGHSADQTAALASERFGRSLSVDAVRQRRSQLRRTLASHILQKRRSHDAVGV